MIVVEHVSKYYGSVAAVSDLHFAMTEGQIIGLLGLNGAGKTTTLQLLSGLIEPTCGRISIAGSQEELCTRVGFLPEIPPLYPEMTVVDFVTFVARIKGVRKNVAQKVEHALDVTDLLDVQHQVIGTLSWGFKKRVGIAQAIVHQPSLILLDEPTSGLDPMQLVHMRQLFQQLRGEHTVVISSHLLSEIQQVCDHLFVMRDGRIVAQGKESDLARQWQQQHKVELEVRASSEAQLLQVLHTLPFIQHIEILKQHQEIIHTHLILSNDERETLAEALVLAGIKLRRLERHTFELENIFLKLTEKEHAA